jgi:hypothetical protein
MSWCVINVQKKTNPQLLIKKHGFGISLQKYRSKIINKKEFCGYWADYEEYIGFIKDTTVVSKRKYM